jgi:hypothetical protein
LLAVAQGFFRAASAEFKLSITRALADQLAEALAGLTAAPLCDAELMHLRPRPGVYELYLRDQRVYVGKASRDLPSRLANHLRKLSGRRGIDLADMSFLCLYVDEDLEAAAPETLLIKKYREQGGSPWNTNGFGNKDPGRNRDRSLVRATHFDAIYPIDLDKPIEGVSAGSYGIVQYLELLKAALPYLLRFGDEVRRVGNLRVEVPEEPLPARELLKLAVATLPEGWQATALPGYVILYRERSRYESAMVLWRREAGTVREIAGAARVTASGRAPDSTTDEEE